MSKIDAIPSLSRFSAVKTEIATGTSWRLCSRFSAVTTSSSRVLAAATVALSRVWAKAGGPRPAASIAPDNKSDLFHCIKAVVSREVV